jgi:hypothetical protein
MGVFNSVLLFLVLAVVEHMICFIVASIAFVIENLIGNPYNNDYGYVAMFVGVELLMLRLMFYSVPMVIIYLLFVKSEHLSQKRLANLVVLELGAYLLITFLYASVFSAWRLFSIKPQDIAGTSYFIVSIFAAVLGPIVLYKIPFLSRVADWMISEE